VKVPAEVVSIPTIDIVCAGPVAVTFAPASNTYGCVGKMPVIAMQKFNVR